MSNQIIGQVYATMIERIIADSKDDFEAAGLDQETLQELKQTWQQNISKLEIAHCPWDPPPPQAQMANPPTVPSNAKVEQHYKTEYKPEQFKQDGSGASTPAQMSNQPTAGVPVKQEPNIKYEVPPQQAYQPQQAAYGGFNPQAAQQRAQNLMQQQYGAQANASIQAMSQNRPMPMPANQRPNHIQMPGQPRPPQPQYQQHPSSLGAAQTDGAADDALDQWRSAMAERRAMTQQDRAAADHQLREYLHHSVAAEDDGIFLPLTEKARVSTKRRLEALGTGTISGPSQYDGAGEEDNKDDIKKDIDDDEDAINSDLDDTDDELANADDEDDEGPVGETILCTYDKVQRVKNKWKCTLKDGILTTNKKEYVFHKANGEFEW